MNIFKRFILFRLFIESSHAFSYFILVQMICTVVVLSCAIFQCDLVILLHFPTNLKSFNIFHGFMHFQLMQNIGFGIMFVLMLVSINILNLFLYCFFGKMATDSFKEMSICLYKTNWQNLPVDLQKFVVLMIGNAQRPLYYHGFGVAILDLETFTKVRKKG